MKNNQYEIKNILSFQSVDKRHLNRHIRMSFVIFMLLQVTVRPRQKVYFMLLLDFSMTGNPPSSHSSQQKYLYQHFIHLYFLMTHKKAVGKPRFRICRQTKSKAPLKRLAFLDFIMGHAGFEPATC